MSIINVLFQIILLEGKSSRIITKIIQKMSSKFPEDIYRLIFIPLLNIDLCESTTMLTIAKIYSNHNREGLIT